MRKISIFILAAMAVGAQAQFTEGNLVVSLIGDGGDTTDNQPIAIRELTTSGAVVGSDLALTNIGGKNVTSTWGETSEAQLSRSGNGLFLTICGYNLTPHSFATFSVYDTPRVVASIGKPKSVALSTDFSVYDPNTLKGDGVRCAYSTNGSDYIVTGGDAGLTVGVLGSAPTQFFAGDYSSRTVTMYNGTIYYNGSNAFFGGNGLATWDGTATPPTPLVASPGSSRDFQIVDSNTIYIACSTNAVGLVKMVFDGTNWNEAYRLGGTGVNNIAYTVDNGVPTLYLTSSNGATVLKTTDNGTGFAAWATVYTAPAGTRVRGLDWAPNTYETIVAGSVTTTEGEEFDGDLASLSMSDDSAYCSFNNEETLGCAIEVTGTTTLAAASEIRFLLEQRVDRVGVAYSVSLYRYSTSSFVGVGGGVAPTTDANHESVLSSNASNYIGSGGALKAKVSYTPINDESPAQDGWLHCLDMVQWKIKP